MLEAPAAEIDELYQQMAQGLIEGIPTAIYRSFNFDLLPATHASGVLRFSAALTHPTEITIPVGFLASTAAGQRYQTVEVGIIPIGVASVDVPAAALASGAIGNAGLAAINQPISSGIGLTGVTNPQPFSGGRGVESLDERRLRFTAYVRTLARGTPASLDYIARQATVVDPVTGVAVERVQRATTAETTGHVNLYIHNGTGSTSAALVARTNRLVQGYIDTETLRPVGGYAPAGMRVDVIAMAEIGVVVTLEAQVPVLLRSTALRVRIQEAIADTVRAVPSGGRLRPLDLINAAVALDEVAGASIVLPTLTVPCPISAVLRPSIITVTWV